jgi:transcriptional regulator with XRE-family HTH domain
MSSMTYKMSPTVITGGEAFGKIMRTLRAAAGLTQTQAAAATGCVPGLISLRETGRRQITVHDAATVLGAYGYTLVVMRADDADRFTAPVVALSKPGPY